MDHQFSKATTAFDRARRWFFRLRLQQRGIECGLISDLKGKSPIIRNGGAIRIGEGVGFRGISAAPEIYAAPGGRVDIGAHSYLNSGVCIHASQEVVLGPRCLLAEWVMISDAAFHEASPDEQPKLAPIRIGANVWIGVRAIVLPGVTIGDHTIVGAGAVVTNSLPARCVAAGVPARVIKSFDCPDQWRRR
jgi:acetyltransferase-like isoleucine patch superfamily enzyme